MTKAPPALLKFLICFTEKGRFGVSDMHVYDPITFMAKIFTNFQFFPEANIKIPGTEGHGSLLLKDTAGEKLRRFLDRLMDYRQSQVDILDQNPDLNLGDVTTVNLTILQGGVQVNVVPPEFIASIDMRIAIDVDLNEFEKQLNTWLEESGDGLEINFTAKDDFIEPTKLDDSNPYWVAMKKATDDM